MQVGTLIQQYARAVGAGDDAGAADLEKRLRAEAPETLDVGKLKEAVALRSLWQRYYRAATGKPAEGDKVADLARQLGDVKVHDALALNELAWTLLTDEAIKERDLALALKLAKAAFEACEGKSAQVVDTYARALFDNGNVADAVTQQRQAVQLAADDAALRAELQETLKKYEAKAPAK
jgi:hypothetical protein